MKRVLEINGGGGSTVIGMCLMPLNCTPFFFFLVFIYLAILGLSCGTRYSSAAEFELSCGMWDLVPELYT